MKIVLNYKGVDRINQLWQVQKDLKEQKELISKQIKSLDKIIEVERRQLKENKKL
jgi:hypothetical protein